MRDCTPQPVAHGTPGIRGFPAGARKEVLGIHKLTLYCAHSVPGAG